MGLKLRVLYLGKMEFPRFRLVECDNEATMVVSPAVALLIQHPTLGNILYDTGNSADFLKTYTPEMLHNYPITEMITIEEALAKEGLTPGDIDQLILSHLHFDHAGGLQHFVGTKAIDHVLVSEADLKQAWWAVTTGNNGAYIRSLFDVEGIRFETIHDTTWLADDLGLFIQASHTPGVIGLILKTEHHGTILTTSDAIYTADSYRQALPPGGTINATTDEFYDNLERIKAMEKNYNATLLFGHDIDQTAADHLLFTCGSLMRGLIPEIEKIAAYAKHERITMADIDAVAEPVLDARIFDMTNAVTARNYDRAAGVLAELLRMQMEPIAILAALGKELRRLYTARLALDGGKDRVWLKELWSMSSDYPAKLLLQAARNVDHDWCRQAVKRCQVLDRRMKSERNMDSEGELKLLLMELAGGR